MGKASVRYRAATRCVWLAAGAAVWLYLVNRVVMHWPNELVKTTTMAALGAGIVASTWYFSGKAERPIWTRYVSLVLGLFSLGEVHRIALRHWYREDLDGSEPASAVSWLRPFTTTDLTRRHHVVKVQRPVGRVRVVHLTDLHLTPALPWSFYQSIIERTNAEQADLVVLTGDLLTKKKYLPLLERWLRSPLTARSGVYAVLGNHEVWAGAAEEVRTLLRAADIHVLSGACERSKKGHLDHVILCGTESPWGPDFGASGATVEDLVLALTHTPDNIYALRGRAHAVFGGHYHGGQLRIPGIGALIVPSVYGRRFDRGHFVVDGTDLFVSAGLGADAPPLRLYCPPELLVVDFVGERAEGDAVARGNSSSQGRFD